jgi:hypothetical protein
MSSGATSGSGVVLPSLVLSRAIRAARADLSRSSCSAPEAIFVCYIATNKPDTPRVVGRHPPGGDPFFQNGGARHAFSLQPRRRTERSLYERANGYNYQAVKIFMPANRQKPVYAPYIEHVPPDVTAGIFWMKNRDPQHWRDSQQLEHVLGKYIISDTPMTPEQWARERADVIDGTLEENHLPPKQVNTDAASSTLPQNSTRRSK